MSAPTTTIPTYSHLVAGVIRRRAAAAGLTIPQLADAAGVPADLLEKRLTDSPLRICDLELVAYAFGARVSDLLAEAEAKRVVAAQPASPLLLDIPRPGWAQRWLVEYPGFGAAATAEPWADHGGCKNMTVRLDQSLMVKAPDRVDEGTAPFRLAWDEPILHICFDDATDRLSFEITLDQARAGWAELSPYAMSAQEIASAQTQIGGLLARFDAAPTATSREANVSSPRRMQAMVVTDRWVTLAVGQARFGLTRDDAVAVWEALQQALRQVPGREVRPLSERVPDGRPIQANADRF